MKTTVMDYDGFLELPDHQKVELKLCQSKFANFPLMSNETFSARQSLIYHIAAHFGKMDVRELMSDPSKTLDNAWPRYFELIITPRLLDYLDLEFFTRYGMCYCCKHYIGYNHMHYKMLGRKGNKVIPISGRCKQQFNDVEEYKTKRKRFTIVTPDYRCHMWYPFALFYNSLQYQIMDNVIEAKGSTYSYNDYALDLKYIDFWRYFFNKYHF